MKEKLKQRLLSRYVSLSCYEKEYIIEVVNYIDSNMEMIIDDHVKFDILACDLMGDGIFKKMTELFNNINNCTTGIKNIDNIIELRKQEGYRQVGHMGQFAIDYLESLDYRTGFFDNGLINYFIAALSNYGGIYMIVYEWERNKEEKLSSSNNKKRKKIQEDS